MYETPTGKIIEEAYLGRNNNGVFPEGSSNVDPLVAALYYAADRKYNINNILKYYDEGYYIILDRYTTSNMAYQGSKILDQDERFYMYQWIDKLEYWLLKLPKPDKTIFLHMPLKYTLELMKNREVLEKPKNKYQNFVHMCDYLASRKAILFEFDSDNNIIC
jgi:dTMP kinase